LFSLPCSLILVSHSSFFARSITFTSPPHLLSTMSHLSDSLPLLPDFAGSPSLVRPKRRSTATFDHSDQEEDDYSKPRSKRNRVVRVGSPSFDEDESGTARGISSEFAGGASGGPAPKALSEKEKDARRQARMIRNRSEFGGERSFNSIDHTRNLTLHLSRSLRRGSSFSGPQEGTYALFGA
jgi:hypothetical protein